MIFLLCELIFPSIYILLSMISAILKRPRTPPSNNAAMDYQTADSEHVLKRSRPFGISDEVQFQSICLSVYHWFASGYDVYLMWSFAYLILNLVFTELKRLIVVTINKLKIIFSLWYLGSLISRLTCKINWFYHCRDVSFFHNVCVVFLRKATA